MNLKNDIIQELARRLSVIIVEDGFYTEPKADFYKGNIDSNNSSFVNAKQSIMSSFNNAPIGEERDFWGVAVEVIYHSLYFLFAVNKSSGTF